MAEVVSMLQFVSATFIYTPEMIADNERRRKRRLVVVLFSQTVSVEAPRLVADTLHILKRFAATTGD